MEAFKDKGPPGSAAASGRLRSRWRSRDKAAAGSGRQTGDRAMRRSSPQRAQAPRPAMHGGQAREISPAWADGALASAVRRGGGLRTARELAPGKGCGCTAPAFWIQQPRRVARCALARCGLAVFVVHGLPWRRLRGSRRCASCLKCHARRARRAATPVGSQFGERIRRTCGALARDADRVQCMSSDAAELSRSRPPVRGRWQPAHAPLRIQFGELAGLSAPAWHSVAGAGFFQPRSRLRQHLLPWRSVRRCAGTEHPPAVASRTEQAACGTCHGLPPAGHDRAQTLRSLPQPHRRYRQQPGPRRAASQRARRCRRRQRHLLCLSRIAGQHCATQRHRRQPRGERAGVGVHQSHLQATHRLRGPIACGDCHIVPSSMMSRATSIRCCPRRSSRARRPL